MASVKMKRMSFDVGPDFDRLLTDLAESGGTTTAEIIRRSVATYAYLRKQEAERHVKVSLIDEEDRIVEEVDLP